MRQEHLIQIYSNPIVPNTFAFYSVTPSKCRNVTWVLRFSG